MSLEKRIENLENIANPSNWVTLIVSKDERMAEGAWEKRCEAVRLEALADGRLKPNDKIIFLARESQTVLDAITRRVLGRE